jgi:hypothetical protein
MDYDENIIAMVSPDYGDNEPTTEYLRVVLDSGPVSTRATDIDLTEPLHDPADEENTNPGLPSHREMRSDNTETQAATPRALQEMR